MRALAIALLFLAACAPTQNHSAHHSAMQEAGIEWASAEQAEREYEIARIILEQALDKDKLTPREIAEARLYNERAHVALTQLRMAFDEADGIRYERARGVVLLNAERMKNLAINAGALE